MRDKIQAAALEVLEQYLSNTAAKEAADTIADQVAADLEGLAADVVAAAETLEAVKAVLSVKTKRGRGRPPGSKNKKAAGERRTKRRGRPAKTKVVEAPVDEDEDLLDDEDLEDVE